MTTRSMPGSRPFILAGIVAAVVAGIAIANDDQTSALWAAAALFGVAVWLVKTGLRQISQG